MLEQHFINFVKEERGEETFIDTNGFVTYKHFPEQKEIMVCDLYVAPEVRGKGHARYYARKVEEIGKERGCEVLTGYIFLKTNDLDALKKKSRTLRIYLQYGLNIIGQEPGRLTLMKTIGDDNE